MLSISATPCHTEQKLVSCKVKVFWKDSERWAVKNSSERRTPQCWGRGHTSGQVTSLLRSRLKFAQASWSTIKEFSCVEMSPYFTGWFWSMFYCLHIILYFPLMNNGIKQPSKKRSDSEDANAECTVRDLHF